MTSLGREIQLQEASDDSILIELNENYVTENLPQLTDCVLWLLDS